jgi:hypothetical protein
VPTIGYNPNTLGNSFVAFAVNLLLQIYGEAEKSDNLGNPSNYHLASLRSSEDN